MRPLRLVVLLLSLELVEESEEEYCDPNLSQQQPEHKGSWQSHQAQVFLFPRLQSLGIYGVLGAGGSGRCGRGSHNSLSATEVCGAICGSQGFYVQNELLFQII